MTVRIAVSPPTPGQCATPPADRRPARPPGKINALLDTFTAEQDKERGGGRDGGREREGEGERGSKQRGKSGRQKQLKGGGIVDVGFGSRVLVLLGT